MFKAHLLTPGSELAFPLQDLRNTYRPMVKEGVHINVSKLNKAGKLPETAINAVRMLRMALLGGSLGVLAEREREHSVFLKKKIEPEELFKLGE